MWPVIVIALNTFRENLRDKILYNLVLFALLLIGASVLLADLTIMEHHKMIADMGLAAINLVGVIIAVFVGIGLVSKEIERRTIYTIMARPIKRTQFILGKYLGLVMTLSVNMAVMVIVFFATLWLYRAPVHGALMQAVALIFDRHRAVFFDLQLVDAERHSDAGPVRRRSSHGGPQGNCREQS
jgi:ABC-type transport system involved in multi-copper enzyme maturation permease subunit